MGRIMAAEMQKYTNFFMGSVDHSLKGRKSRSIIGNSAKAVAYNV